MHLIRTLLLLGAVSALRVRPQASLTRRGCLAGGLSAALGTALPLPSVAEEEDVIVYFGCGCFWHVQHEFVEAERKLLGRDDLQLTAYAGYAGGTKGSVDGKVCYHNAASVADYGKLGHAEAVALKVPPSKFKLVAEEYFKLFDQNGARPDQLGDRGTEYRNIVGLPGGSASPLAKQLVEASKAQGDKLDFAVGKGDDADARGLAWVYDTAQYPFYIAESYHQFHDGFAWGEDYPQAYNGLAAKKAKAGNFKGTACPNGMLGIGIAGL